MKIQLEHLLRAGYNFILVETQQKDLTLAKIKSILHARRDRMNAHVEVFSLLGVEGKRLTPQAYIEEAVKSTAPPFTIKVLDNIQFYLERPEVIQALQDCLPKCAQRNNSTGGAWGPLIFIGLCPTAKVPIELERYATVYTDDMPTREMFRAHATTLESGYRQIQGVSCNHEQLMQAANLATGMTLREFEDACTLSLAAEQTINPQLILELKKSALRKCGMLDLYIPQPTDGPEYVYGMETLKDFMATTMKPGAKGVLILGPPGGGKTVVGKAQSAHADRPFLILDPTRAYSKYVGEAEANMRYALQMLDNFGPSVVLVDELDKALAGASGGDGNAVSARTMGIFLRWLSDRQNDCYLVATCNDITHLPPEYLRAERWDAIFFVDLPTWAEQQGIWGIWMRHYGIPPEQLLSAEDCRYWTGAEIRTCCRLAMLKGLTLQQTKRYVMPIYKTRNQEIQQLRYWAKDRTIPAGIWETPNGAATARSIA